MYFARKIGITSNWIDSTKTQKNSLTPLDIAYIAPLQSILEFLKLHVPSISTKLLFQKKYFTAKNG